MKIIRTIVSIFVVEFFMTSMVYADALDDCRNIIMSGKYTIKYENITPNSHKNLINNKVILTQKSMGKVDSNLMYRPKIGIVISDGKNKYNEISTSIGGLAGEANSFERAYCSLVLDEEKFDFIRDNSNIKREIEYAGQPGGKGKVIATPDNKNFLETGFYYFGNPSDEINIFLQAMMPNDNKMENSIMYEKVKSGKLENGLYYVDMKIIENDSYKKAYPNEIFNAIRYYFDKSKLVKIAAARYFNNYDGKIDGIRTVIKINEFNGIPDQSYLKLPEGLKDVTKR